MRSADARQHLQLLCRVTCTQHDIRVAPAVAVPRDVHTTRYTSGTCSCCARDVHTTRYTSGTGGLTAVYAPSSASSRPPLPPPLSTRTQQPPSLVRGRTKHKTHRWPIGINCSRACDWHRRNGRRPFATWRNPLPSIARSRGRTTPQPKRLKLYWLPFRRRKQTRGRLCFSSARAGPN